MKYFFKALLNADLDLELRILICMLFQIFGKLYFGNLEENRALGACAVCVISEVLPLYCIVKDNISCTTSVRHLQG
jgi:hypothetical protein